MKEVKDLLRHLDLERIEKMIFRGQNSYVGSPNVFGGQVLAQALNAASETIGEDRCVHSLHAYFILPGDLSLPIVYEVENIRDGGSFSTRRILAIQKGRPIFNMAASFQKIEPGYEHQMEMPEVPGPEGLQTREEIIQEYEHEWPEIVQKIFRLDRPIEFRPVEKFNPMNTGVWPAKSHVWMRTKGPMPDDAKLHRTVLAYVSDYNLLVTAMFPHGDKANLANTQLASLDHAMWFHHDFRIDEWLLYAIESPSASNARGFCRANVFTRSGKLVASVTQEGLMRKWTKKKK